MLQAVFKRESVLFVKGAKFIGKLIPGELVFLRFRFVQIGCNSLYHMFGNSEICFFYTYFVKLKPGVLDFLSREFQCV